ncbi:MAG: HEAT repeat domain-containing protein [Leptospiraceae bacterium]|nr:HEAT repeat domain-containing protein [Leptospiraceae bacterium]
MSWKKKINLSVVLTLSLYFCLHTSYFAKEDIVSSKPNVESEAPEQLPGTESSAKPEERSSSKSKKGLTPEQIVKKKEILEKVLKFGSNKERREAMRELLHFPKEHGNELYTIVADSLATETDMGVKISFIKGLAELNYRKNSEPIIKALNDKSDDVREAAIFAIQKMKLEEGAGELVKLLKDQDFSKNQMLTTNAITALSELESGKEIAGFLESKFREKTTHSNVRAAIALYFGKTKDKIAESALIDIASDESEEQMTRAYAVNSLGKMSSQKSIPFIRSILEKINDSKNKFDTKKFANLKIYCISALVSLGDSEILKELITYAKDDDANIRIRAIKQLAETPNKDVLELIEYKAVRDPSRKVQEVAKKVLEDLKKKDEPPPIVEPKPVPTPVPVIDNKPEQHKPMEAKPEVKPEPPKPEVKQPDPEPAQPPGKRPKRKGASWN